MTSINQSSTSVLIEYFELLFHCEDYKNSKIEEIVARLIQRKEKLSILICGCGVGINEAPLLYNLLTSAKQKGISEIELFCIDKDRIFESLFSKYLNSYFICKKNNCEYKDFKRKQKKIILDQGNDINVNLNEYGITYKFKALYLEPYYGQKNIDNDLVNDTLEIDGTFDLILLPFIINHIEAYWYSLFAYLNSKLNDNGIFLINENKGDSRLFNGELFSWRNDNNEESDKVILYDYYKEWFKEPLEIISDNPQIAANNIEMFSFFIEFLNKKKKLEFSVEYSTKQSLNFFFNILNKEEKVFSIYMKYKYFLNKIKIEKNTIKKDSINKKKEVTLKIEMKWFSVDKIIQSELLDYFNPYKNDDKKEFNGKEFLTLLNNFVQENTMKFRTMKNSVFYPYNLYKNTKEEVQEIFNALFQYYFNFIIYEKFGIESIDAKFGYKSETLKMFITKNKELSKGVADYYEIFRTDKKESITKVTTSYIFYKLFYNITTKPFFVIENENLNDEFKIEIKEFENCFLFSISFPSNGEKISNDSKNNAIEPLMKIIKVEEINFLKNNLDQLIENYYETKRLLKKNIFIFIPYFTSIQNYEGKKNILENVCILTLKEEPKDINEFIESNTYLMIFFYAVIQSIEKIMNLNFWSNYFYFNQNIIQKSKQSAISQIMARNMSHNLGSHVLSYARTDLKKQCKSEEDCKNEPYIWGIANLLGYLQERQDFIASVAEFKTFLFATINFKEFIFDNFLPDKRFERHPGSTGLKKNKNIILDYIGRSEEYRRNQIFVKFRDFDGGIINDKERNCEGYHLIKNLEMAIPTGVLGRQAFYSILENFIRNSMKHATNKNKEKNEEKKKELIIILDTPELKVDNDQGLTVSNNEIMQSVKIIEETGEKIIEYSSSEYIRFSIVNNLGDFENAKEKIFWAMKDALVDDYGQLNPLYKGIKEMKICAAWLRGELGNLITEKATHFPYLGLINDNGNLGYTFLIRKPKELLIICENDKTINRFLNVFEKDEIEEQIDVKQKISFYGVDLVTKDEFFGNEESQNIHTLNVIEDSFDIDTREKIVSKLNQRVILLDKNKKDTLLSKIEDSKKQFSNDQVSALEKKDLIKNIVEDLLLYCWELRVKEKFLDEDEKLPSIYISDRNEIQKQQLKAESENSYNMKYFKNFKELNNKIDNAIVLFDHFESEEKFRIVSAYEGFDTCRYMEGITGGNSTDLYYRNVEKSRILYFKLLESFLTKILIIDERIWELNKSDQITKVKNEKSDVKNNFVDYWFKKINDNDFIDQLCEKKQLLKNEVENLYRTYKKKAYQEDENFKRKYFKDIFSGFINDTESEFENIPYNVFKKRGIEIMNVDIPSNEEKSGDDISYQSFSLINLLRESYSDGFNFKNDMNFHVVSIHQGILDKIRNHLNKSDGFDSKMEASKQEKLNYDDQYIINKIKEKMKDAIVIIHSGRSKPPELPKDALFVSFSSLDNTIKDSKYILTNILYQSKLEN